MGNDWYGLLKVLRQLAEPVFEDRPGRAECQSRDLFNAPVLDAILRDQLAISLVTFSSSFLDSFLGPAGETICLYI